jgi:hypothetical protein
MKSEVAGVTGFAFLPRIAICHQRLPIALP